MHMILAIQHVKLENWRDRAEIIVVSRRCRRNKRRSSLVPTRHLPRGSWSAATD
jgi:hypothetical protein